MKPEQIPYYTDEGLKDLRQSARYPCNTDYMTYDVYMHRYKLTNDALLAFGIDAEANYDSNAPSKIEHFIDEVTEDVYGIIDFFAPFNIEYNYCLVAQSQSGQIKDRYTARKQFELALLYQAEYKLKNTDVRDFNGINTETGTNISPKALRKENRHIAPRTLDILDKLGLLYNGDDIPKNINFERYM